MRVNKRFAIFISLILGLVFIAGVTIYVFTPKSQTQTINENATQKIVNGKLSYKPKNGYVPNAETAKSIAEAIWLPIYGDKVLHEKPYTASLSADNVWTVTGTLPKMTLPKMTFGVVAEIDISKSDGTILRVIHGK